MVLQIKRHIACSCLPFVLVLVLVLIMCNKADNAGTNKGSHFENMIKDFPTEVLSLAKKKISDSLMVSAKAEIATSFNEAELVLIGTIKDLSFTLKSKDKDQAWRVATIMPSKIIKGEPKASKFFISGLGNVSPLMRDPSIFSLNDTIQVQDKCAFFLSKSSQLSQLSNESVYGCSKFIVMK